MRKMKLVVALLMVTMMLVSLLVGCNTPQQNTVKTESNAKTESNGKTEVTGKTEGETSSTEQKAESKSNASIILATTTSTQDSGLLSYLIPKFKEKTGIEVKVVAVGSGKAFQMGKDGEADVLLVHAKTDEELFIKDGHGTQRHDVMYNDFVLVGPKEDDLKLIEQFNKDILGAMKAIAQKKAKFISRGDDSGTHKKEKELWTKAGVKYEGGGYILSGKGMGEVLTMTNEMKGYTLSDRATYLSMKDKIELKVLVEGSKELLNQYGVIPVNPNKNNKINKDGANAFEAWILSKETQKLISEFGVEKYGQALFIPNAK